MDSVRLNQLAALEMKTADAFHEHHLSAMRLFDEMEAKGNKDYLEARTLGVPENIALRVLRQVHVEADRISREGYASLDRAQYHLDRAQEFQRLRNEARLKELRVRFSNREV